MFVQKLFRIINFKNLSKDVKGLFYQAVPAQLMMLMHLQLN